VGRTTPEEKWRGCGVKGTATLEYNQGERWQGGGGTDREAMTPGSRGGRRRRWRRWEGEGGKGELGNRGGVGPFIGRWLIVIFRKWKMGIGTVRMPTVRKYCTTQKTGKGKRNKMDRVII
jgi:hypothetical protein